VAGQEWNAHVESALMQMAREVRESLRRVAKAVYEKDCPLVAGAQVDRTCAVNYVCCWNGI
jgi:hypothetical protein